VLRGLHFQLRHPQAKLVRVTQGTVFDVAVDMRRNSQTFGKWHGEILSAENRKQMYIPENFAHGFCVLSDNAEFLYKCTDFYVPGDEAGLMWNDPQIGIEWPIHEPILSPKDAVLPGWADALDLLPSGE
jgi:dTDP-4-dehydrorhamnose 3,5-epimerase